MRPSASLALMMPTQRKLGLCPPWCSAEIWTKAADEFDRCERDLYDANPDAPASWLAERAQRLAEGCHGYAVRLTGEGSNVPPPTT